MHIIVPLTKSSYFGGRYGPVEKQDWYRVLAKASALLKSYRPARILLISAAHIAGEESEIEASLRVLAKLGVSRSDIFVIRRAQETIERVEIAAKFAKLENVKMIIVSTFLHYLRVRYLCRGLGAEHYAAFGIPRPQDLFWNIALTFAFPIIDTWPWGNGRQWFREKVKARRESGKL